MGKAFLILRRSASIEYENGRILSVRMDLYSIQEPRGAQDFRFSWIAFDLDDPEKRVLFDSHPPKGPHFHIGHQEGVFEWRSISQALKLFFEFVEKEFGPHPDFDELAKFEGEDQ